MYALFQRPHPTWAKERESRTEYIEGKLKPLPFLRLLDCVRQQKAIQNGERETSQPVLPVGELLIMFIVLEQKATKQVT